MPPLSGTPGGRPPRVYEDKVGVGVLWWGSARGHTTESTGPRYTLQPLVIAAPARPQSCLGLIFGRHVHRMAAGDWVQNEDTSLPGPKLKKLYFSIELVLLVMGAMANGRTLEMWRRTFRR
jgi:hypothetical protein